MNAETDTDSIVMTKPNSIIKLPQHFLASIDSSYPYPSTDYGKRFTSKIDLDYRPSFVKDIGGVWLLVAGRDSFAEIYS